MPGEYNGDDDRVWLLIANKLANEATTEEIEELELIIQQYEEVAEMYKVLKQFWSCTKMNLKYMNGNDSPASDGKGV